MQDRLDNLVAVYRATVLGELKPGVRSVIEGELEQGYDCQAIDDILQFTLAEGTQISPQLLDQTAEVIDWWWDEALRPRTLAWVEAHRARNAAAA